MESAQQNRSLLLFKVGPYNFCAPVDRVEGVILPPPITTIPMAPPSIAGTFVFREQAAVIVDMWQKLGLNHSLPDNPDLLIVTSLDSGLVAFKVESVSEIIHAEQLKPCKLPFAKVYQLFEKFMLRGDDILLLTDFELLFATGEMGHLLADLTESLARHSKDTLAYDVVDNGQPNRQGKAELAVEGGTQEPADKSATMDTETDKGLDEGSGRVAIKIKEVQYSKKKPVAKPKSRPAPRAAIRSKPRPKPVNVAPRRRPRSVAPLIRPDTGMSADYVAMSTLPRRENGRTPYVLSGLFIVALILLAAFYIYPGSDREDRASVTPINDLSEARPVKQVDIAPPEVEGNTAAEDIAVVDTPSQFESEEENTTGLQSQNKTTIPAKAVVVRTGEIASAPSQELLRVETDDFTLTVQRPAKVEDVVDKSVPPAPEAAPSQPVVLPGINQNRDIVHRVIKGDTLWDIAEKYLGDPYSYKDLADLSQIRDPHWIYPGDIIRIVIKNGAKEGG